MAKLYFRYGAMGSSKTANALMIKFNYEERGMKVQLLKPKTDTRDTAGTIASRIGQTAECHFFEDFIANGKLLTQKDFNCIIVDEAQFLMTAQVIFLSDIVDEYDIPVICYGLRTDFTGKLFEGSTALMAYADTIEEIKTVCWCGKKATFNARYNQDGIVRSGAQVEIGANAQYCSLCRKHFKMGLLKGQSLSTISGKTSHLGCGDENAPLYCIQSGLQNTESPFSLLTVMSCAKY